MSTWNGNNFSIYKSEEKQVLKLIKELGDQVNYNTDNKTDKTGDHAGTWQGISKPTLSNEGLGGTVELHTEQLSKLKPQDDTVIIARDMKLESTGIDNTGYLDTLINNAPEGSTIRLPAGVFIYNGSKVIEKRINLISDGATIKTTLENHNIFFYFHLIDDFFIQGINFDNNLKGRTCIDIFDCKNVKIINNHFTGYSAEYGHYQTDSAIRISKVENCNIEGNVFKNFGNQYGATLETLNRCIAVNDVDCKNIIIKGNMFDEVNQAIVNAGSYIIVEGNIFKGVHDNAFYGVYGDNVSIIGNQFINGLDEVIVVKGKNIIINGNHFINNPNKAIAINGAVYNIIINGNVFDNSEGIYGQMIVWRTYTDLVSNIIISDNQFINNIDTLSYPYFILGNVTNLNFHDNYMKLTVIAGQKIMSFEGTTATGTIHDNTFDCVGGDDTALAISVGTSVLTFELFVSTNKLLKCRISGTTKLTMQNQQVQTNAGPYGKDRPSSSLLYNTTFPTTGTWKQGDLIYNTTPNAGAYVGWICTVAGTPGTWKGFGLIQA